MAVARRGEEFERENRIGAWWWLRFWDAFFKVKG